MLQRSKRQRCTLFLVALGCLVTGVTGQVTSCLPPNAVSPGVQPAQPRVPNSLRVRVEMTEEGRNSTRQLELIVDGDGNRALLTDMDNGTQTTVRFLYYTQEIIYIKGAHCTVKNMSADPGRFVLFGDPMTDGRGHIPDGATVLYFGQDIAKVYKGRQVVRGIQCDWWQTCISAPFDRHQNLSIDYYFSVKTWTTPSLFSPAPIRYEVTDTQAFDNGTVDTRRYVLDFFDFIPDMDSDPSVFETPEGVVCSGRINTKAMPALPSRYFHFQEEMVDLGLYYDRITQAEIWYDLDQKLVRVDYRSPIIASPLYTTNPVSVINDYSYGVSYVKDLVSGECAPMALAPNSFDGRLNAAAFRSNGSFVLSMKPPSSFFFLDSNFTYSGQRYTRNALCDVYISHRDDFDAYNNGSALEATVEAYFLAVGWREFSKDSLGQVSEQFPFRVQAWVPKLNQNVMYNIFNFDTSHPDVSMFDVTDCYNDSTSLTLRVRFLGGPYHRDREHEVMVKGQNSLASVLRVSPLRVNHLQLQYDASYLYIIATLLDRTPSLAQFTHLPKAVIEKDDDNSWAKIDSAAGCSDLCVRNPEITCLSFEYCPNERGGTCRISRRHISDGNVSVVPGRCDLYSRTVNVVGPPEITAKEAYYKLKDAISKYMLFIQITEDNQEEVDYVAVDAEMLFGRLEEVSLPTLTGQFSYRVETVFPRNKLVHAYDVWYDSVSKLARVDQRDLMAGAPYYTPFTVTSIHDYKTGISYNVDTSRGNCTVASIPSNQTYDGQAVNWTEALTTGRLTLAMKSPQQLLHLDHTYTFTGQKTVRGILCDVFESKRTDFSLGPGIQQSIFQYFFQSRSWQYEADTHDDITMQQPVQLVISDEKANQFITYNFYDYNDEHTTFDKFNIAPCFTDEQRIDFVLDFNQTYHPYLDANEWLFKQEVLFTLSSQLKVSQLRVQNLRVTYNLDQTFVMATLLGQVAPQLHFAEAGTSSPYNTHVVTPQSDVTGCAASCFYSHDLVCNSFDLCPDRHCYLSSRHVPDGNVTQPGVKCRHFSRLTNGTVPEPSVDDAFTGLKDMVYKGLFTVIMSTDRGDQQISFTAVGVRDDIFQLTPPTETGAADLHSKFRLYKTDSRMSQSARSLPGLAVDACAAQCWHQELFTCNAFSYCYGSGDCLLSASRPALNPGLLGPAPLCDVYSRLYLDGYTQYRGQAMEVTDGTDKTVQGLLRPEDCARHCSLSTPFTCRSFDFCPSTGHCLLHQRHVLDYRAPLSNSTLCSHFSRNYLADFTLQVGKAVTTGDGDLAVSDAVSATTCALRCVQEGSCQNFEFCEGQCRLSSLLPSPEIVTDSSFCDLYTLTASAEAADRGPLVPVVPVDKTSTTKSPGSPSNRPSPSSAVSTRHMGGGGASVSRTPPSHGTTTGAAVSHEGCSGKQRSDGQSDTGVRVGIGVGMLVLGVLLGMGLVLLVQRLMGRRGNEDSIELVPRLS